MLKTRFILPFKFEYLSKFQSKETQRAYLSDLNRFEDILNQEGIDKIQDVNHIHLIKFKTFLVAKFSNGSVNRKIASTKSYFDFLLKMGIIEKKVHEFLEKLPDRFVPTPQLNDDEVKKIFSVIDGNTCKGKRDLAIMHLLFYLGLRRSEIVALKMGNLNSHLGVPTIDVVGKGGRSRTLPLPEETFTIIKNYLNFRHVCNENDPLFHSIKHGNKSHLHHNSITVILHNYCMEAEIKRISPHSARVTCISNALENGATLIQAQQLGGWKNLEMVLRYDRRRQELKNSAAYKVNYRKEKL